MENFLETIGKQILAILQLDREFLKESPAELSELTLMVDDQGALALDFDVLGQNFLLKTQGLFTFNELGEPLVLEPAFQKEIKSYLGWRLRLLENFEV